MTRSRYYQADEQTPHFLTATINGWLPVFSNPDIVGIVINSLRFLQQNARLEIFAYVILENHLHMIARSPDISREIKRFKSYTAKEILTFLQERQLRTLSTQLELFKRPYKTKSDYQLWEEGSHLQVIVSEAVMRQKVEYIHYNPVRRGYVEEPTHWRYSSAKDYEGGKGILDITTLW
jgi:REP element-mobilizing transposase RayT